MSFSNPAGAAKANAAAYVRSLLDLLGERDPIEVLEELVPSLEGSVSGLSEAMIRKREAPGKWSIIEVLQHLADHEIVAAYRYRIILAHDRPEVQGYDQEAWTRRLGYEHARPSDAIEQLRALRGVNLRLLRSLAPEQLDRVGLHVERGPESVRRAMELNAGHDLVHRRQIDRIRSAWE